MANITGYLNNIRSAARGEDVRDSIINALKAINADNPNDVKPLNVTANGTYTGESGIVYNPVTVNVPEGASQALSLVEKKIVENGEFEADDGTAFFKVTVEVPQYTNEIMEEITITENGDYEALLDGYDGYGTVHVNVQQGGGSGTFTVYFMEADRTTVYEKVVGVPAGGGAVCHRGNPTSSGMRFVGWTPNPLQIYADTYCYPRFENVIYDETQIQDDWVTIARNVRTDPDAYNIGQWKLLELGEEFRFVYKDAEYVYNQPVFKMRLTGKMADPLEGENGYAPTTWDSFLGIKKLTRIDGGDTNMAFGPIGTSWRESPIRTLFNTYLYAIFPEELKPYLRRVIKYTMGRTSSGIFTRSDATIDWVWSPACKEIGTIGYELSPPTPMYEPFDEAAAGTNEPTRIAYYMNGVGMNYLARGCDQNSNVPRPNDTGYVNFYGAYNSSYDLNSVLNIMFSL